MKRFIMTAGACVLAVALLACGGKDEAPSTQVIGWNRFASDLVATNPLPPFQVRGMALVQLAVHDAINTIEPRYAAYRYSARAPGASVAAAVAAASRDTLLSLLPAAAAQVEAEYQAQLALIANGPAKDAGVAAGAK